MLKAIACSKSNSGINQEEVRPHNSSPGKGSWEADNQDLLIRVVRYPAAEAGTRQFLGIGSGCYPTERARGRSEGGSDAQVVYVVLRLSRVRHSEALLTTTEHVRDIKGDLRDHGILGSKEVAELIDPTGR